MIPLGELHTFLHTPDKRLRGTIREVAIEVWFTTTWPRSSGG